MCLLSNDQVVEAVGAVEDFTGGAVELALFVCAANVAVVDVDQLVIPTFSDCMINFIL